MQDAQWAEGIKDAVRGNGSHLAIGGMMLTAKTIVKNKFWIVEDDGNKVATIQASEDGGVVYVHGHKREKFPSVKVLGTKYNISFDKTRAAKVPAPKKGEDSEYSVHGYPCGFLPFNTLYDVSKRLPVFTKSEKSKSFYCAGYYIIKFEKRWVQAYCPKLITLSRNQFCGPFKTRFESQAQLRIENGKAND